MGTQRSFNVSLGHRLAKRGLDVLGAVVLLVVLCPVLLVVAIVVRLNLGAPVLYRQVRPGLEGRAFAMYKFRTMTNEHDEHGQLLEDSIRLTPFGRWIRAASLDELPELFNVLRGDMSLVGPRPLLMKYLPLYSPRQARRHEVRPGITGWAQVNGRNALQWGEKFELDVWYVENQSIWLDLKIIWLTIWKVLRREGISADNSATMPEFRGSSAGVRHDEVSNG